MFPTVLNILHNTDGIPLLYWWYPRITDGISLHYWIFSIVLMASLYSTKHLLQYWTDFPQGDETKVTYVPIHFMYDEIPPLCQYIHCINLIGCLHVFITLSHAFWFWFWFTFFDRNTWKWVSWRQIIKQENKSNILYLVKTLNVC